MHEGGGRAGHRLDRQNCLLRSTVLLGPAMLEDNETRLLQSIGKHKRNDSASHCRTNDSRSVEKLNIAWEVTGSEVAGDVQIMAWL